MFKIIKFIFVILFLTKGLNYSVAQNTLKSTKMEIDSGLSSIIKLSTKVDTVISNLCGVAKFYKRKFGIKVKIGEGYANGHTVLAGDKLFMNLKYSKNYKRFVVVENDDEFYFINNELVKYISSKYSRLRCKETWTIKHRITLYFKNNELLDKVLLINDHYNYSKIDLKWILSQAMKIENEYNNK